MFSQAIVGQTSRRHRGEPACSTARDDLERHLARCRRSGSRAALLAARVGDRAGFASDLERHLRLSDSALLSAPGELLLLCDAPPPHGDAPPLDRVAVERRLQDLADGPLECGWAAFPDEGLSLADLVRRARRATAPDAYAPSATLLAIGA